MKRGVDLLVSVGLLLSLIGAVGQLIHMLLGLILPQIRWYWGGSVAYLAAPVAFAVTRRLLATSKLQDIRNA